MYSKCLAVAATALVVAATSLLATVTTSVDAVFGGDISQPFSVEAFECTKRNGMEFIVVRCYQSFGRPDPNALTSLNNAKAAGIQYRDVYHFPCVGRDAAAQIRESVDAVGKGNFGMMWLDIETSYSPGCEWSANRGSNCQFIGELIKAAQAMGVHVGVYSSIYMWNDQTAGASCTAGADNGAPLWYAHYDGRQTFDDFVSFGGWHKPNVKQYNDKIDMCGMNSDADWYP